MLLLKNSAGKKSVSFTMMIVSFVVVMIWMLLSIFESLGPLHIRAFSGTDALAVLSPMAALYFGRRGQELKVEDNK